jgi:hypothetical protein
MTDVVNSYFKRFYPVKLDAHKWHFSTMLGGMLEYRDYDVSKIFPRMECADGFSMSVQGHAGAYSRPRDDFADSYSMVEIGYPTAREELLMPYVEDAKYPTDTVYGYVPVDIVEKIIAAHGGLKTES